MFAEDMAVFFDVPTGFALAATLAGNAVDVIRDRAAFDEFDGREAIIEEPSVLVPRAEAPAAAAGQTLVIGSDSYLVRQVLPEPPDGQLLRLMLAVS